MSGRGHKHKFADETLIAKVTPVTSGFSEPELYVEPTQMAPRDTLGVVVALVALALIGVSGYIWLNPKLDVHSLLALRAAKPAAVPMQSAPPATAGAHISCPYCGMYADTSESTVALMWADGGSATFDSFDCVFNYIKEKHVKLDSGTVRDYEAKGGDKWIDLKQASYLYDTTATVEGSMPPYVAAFDSKVKAEAAKKTMGGEVMDFAGLKGKWEK